MKKEHKLITEENAIYRILSNAQGEDKKKLTDLLLNYLPETDRQEMSDIMAGRKLPSLSSDVIAKKIFDADEHPERLEFLLREISKDSGIRIDSAYRNEGYTVSFGAKKMILDLPAKLIDSTFADLEIQAEAQKYIMNRGDIYASDMLMLQYSVSKGQSKTDIDYSNVSGVLLIVLMQHSPKEFNEYKTEHYIHRFADRMADSGLIYKPLQKVIYVQLDKCFAQLKKGLDGENNRKLQILLSAMYNSNDKTVLKMVNEENDVLLNGILKDVEILSFDKEVQSMLLAEKYAAADLNAVLDYKKEEGIEQGIEQGKKKFIRNMLKNNESVNKIMEYSECTYEQVMQVKKDMLKENPQPMVTEESVQYQKNKKTGKRR